MIAVLQAEENITAVNVAAIGSGLMPSAEQRHVLNTWRAAIRRQAYSARSSGGRTLADLIGSGIGVHRG